MIRWDRAAPWIACGVLFLAGGPAAAQKFDEMAAGRRELRSINAPLTDDVKEKLEDLAAEVRKNPDDALKLAQYGWALTKVGKSEEGLAALTRATAQAPSEPRVQLLVARGLWKVKQIEEAADAALIVARSPLASPKDAAEALRLLGFVRWEQGRSREAEEYFREGLTRDPNNGPLLLTLGGLLRGSNRTAEALTMLDKAAEKSPRDPKVLQKVAQQMEDMGRLDRAKELWEQLAALVPEDPDAAFIAAAHEWRAEEYDKVVERLGRSLKITPNDANAQLLYAQALLRLKRFDEARRAAEMSQKLGNEYAIGTIHAIDEEQRQAGQR